MQAVNNDFRSIFGARSFMTAMCVALDPKTGRASIVGAGHPPLIILRRDGTKELINSCAPPLGLAEPKQFVKSIVDLAPGDAFILYTGRSLRRNKWRKIAEHSGAISRNARCFGAKRRSVIDAHIECGRARRKGNGSLPDDLAAVVIRRKK